MTAAVAAIDALAAPRPRRQRWGIGVVAVDVLVGASLALVAAFSTTQGALARAGILAVWPLLVACAGGYTRLAADSRRPSGMPVVTAALAAATMMWAITALTAREPGDAAPRTLAATSLGLAAAALLASGVGRSLVTVLTPHRPLSTVLVGTPAQVEELLRESSRPGVRCGFTAVAVCLPESAIDGPEGRTAGSTEWPVPVWAGVGEPILEAVRVTGAEAVVVAPGPGIGPAELRRWAAWLQREHVRLLVSPGLRDVAQHRLATTTWGDSRLFGFAPAPLTGPSRAAKSVVDRTVGTVLLLLAAPLLAALALLIRLESPGRAFYRQTRVGRDGRPFTLYKLRSMRADADDVRETLEAANESDGEGLLFKIRKDPRVTRLGSFLRRSSLDELPQLLNVALGDMSLIGPRPALPTEVRVYSADVRRRLDVKPGLTGLWQVSGRSDLSWEETIRLDLRYVDNWSWRMDLRIAVRTVRAVLSRRGAY